MLPTVALLTHYLTRTSLLVGAPSYLYLLAANGIVKPEYDLLPHYT